MIRVPDSISEAPVGTLVSDAIEQRKRKNRESQRGPTNVTREDVKDRVFLLIVDWAPRELGNKEKKKNKRKKSGGWGGQTTISTRKNDRFKGGRRDRGSSSTL